MKYFDYFDGAFYINLETRTDRRESFEQKAADAGLIVPRFNAVSLKPEEVASNPNDPNWHKKISSATSHMRCIQLAKDNGWQNCLIFEDDCIFMDDFMPKAQACIEDLRVRDWDMFFFGGEPAGPCESETQNIVRTTGVYGAHAYAINRKFYDTILRYPSDRNLIDIIFIHHSSQAKAYFLAKELLIWQDDDRYPSDLWIKSGSENIYREAYKKYVP